MAKQLLTISIEDLVNWAEPSLKAYMQNEFPGKRIEFYSCTTLQDGDCGFEVEVID
jgi:hypothetical protein